MAKYDWQATLSAHLSTRFGGAGSVPEVLEHARGGQPRPDALLTLASHRSHRAFTDDVVPLQLIEALAHIAFSAPSKSDLQQRDLIIIEDAMLLADLKACIADQQWTAGIDRMLIVCGNNRRQRQIHEARGHEFVNDHLDAFFNTAVDAGILLQAFVTAAEAVGLGCCPISGIRNQAARVSELLALPDYVYPVAGLAVGWPRESGEIAPRLSLKTTLHVDQFDDAEVLADVDAYDQRRHSQQPIARQRNVADFGACPSERYGWSEDKARQYAQPERADFGAFVKKKRFSLT